MSYFQHHYASNSDVKKLIDRHNGKVEMEGIKEVYEFGTEFHSGILERHKMRDGVITDTQTQLIRTMSDTFWKDEMCRNIMLMQDFRREHEFYRVNRMGFEGVRCKCDGESASLRVILELKGLSVTTQKQFIDSVEYLKYDQGAGWYINTASGYVQYRAKLIVGISKKQPDRLFKLLIDRDHQLYKQGMWKIQEGNKVWKSYGLK
jgi:hypothetical protein